MTQQSLLQPLINNYPVGYVWKGSELFQDEKGPYIQLLIENALKNASNAGHGVFMIPLGPLLDGMRRISGNEDESDRCMHFVRKNIQETHSAEVGRIGDNDSNYIIMYPKGARPADFRKSKTNTLTTVELVKVALFSLENEVKPYQIVCGIKVTRSNLSTAREIADVIIAALPGIKVTNFASQFSISQIDQLISKFNEIKKSKEKDGVILLLKEKGYSDEAIERLIKS